MGCIDCLHNYLRKMTVSENVLSDSLCIAFFGCAFFVPETKNSGRMSTSVFPTDTAGEDHSIFFSAACQD